MMRATLLARAYSILTLKSVDTEQRTITGVATTPTPDRHGDIVEPLGATFTNPIPLLLFHDRQRPVGIATLDRPTAQGITFTAHIPDIPEPGPLRDRVSEAWQSLKAGLIRGVSVGIRAAHTGVELMRGGGMRLKEYEIGELSLCTIPANAEATIALIKSLDAPYLAAWGEPAEPVSITPGVSGTRATTPGVSGTSRRPRSSRAMQKSISEQITDLETRRVTAVTALNDLQTKCADEGRTKNETERDQFASHRSEIESIDEELKDLRDVERINKALAVPAAGGSPTVAADARAGLMSRPVISVERKLPPGIEFTRMVLCKAASFCEMQKGNFVSALDIAKSRYPDEHRIHEVLKAAVPAGTTTDGTYAGPLVYAQNLADEFVEFLRPMTILGKFGTNGIPSLRRVPFNIRYVGQTSDAEAYWVGQGKPKPLTRFALESNTLGFAKVATIAVLTEESVRFSSPSSEQMARDALAAAIIKRIDIDFIDPDKTASANVSPASITNGVAPLSSAGTSADNVRSDLMNLLSTFVENNNPVSQVVLIMPDSLALSLSLMVNSLGQDEFPNMSTGGGRLRGLPVITSQYVSSFTGRGNMVIAVNASEIFLADDGQVTVDVSREASLEMSDSPTQNGAAGTGASLVSLWQNNMVGLRAERFINWAKRRSEAVAFIDDVNWGAIGSPAL